ncbi:hypothetical protein Rhal01_02131 [Rubritalea halochordaticola]|uniref:DUF4292 domain-containing protein n=1 Tax=Rubritalea halochordaticola TaxID=714537 RepID=A0ABP9V1U3_9BACT
MLYRSQFCALTLIALAVSSCSRDNSTAREEATPTTNKDKGLIVTCDYKDTELRVILADLLRQTLANKHYRGKLRIDIQNESTLSRTITLNEQLKLPFVAYLEFLRTGLQLHIRYENGVYIITDLPPSHDEDIDEPITKSYLMTEQELNRIGLYADGKPVHLDDGSPWPNGENETATFSVERKVLVMRADRADHTLLDSLLFITRNSEQALNIKDYQSEK